MGRREAEPQEPDPDAFYVIEPHGRYFAVFENPDQLLIEEALSGPPEKKLVAVCVYRRGAEEVVRRLAGRVVVRARYARLTPRRGFAHEDEPDPGAALTCSEEP